MRATVVALFFVFLAASPLQAGEPPSREALLGRGLDLVRTRVEAQMGLAETLREAGKLEEAVAAYREAAAIYERELGRIEAHLASVGLGKIAAVQPTATPGADAFPGRRGAAGHDSGASTNSLDAVDAGLRWLAAHQSPNGGWSPHDFGNWCNGKQRPESMSRPDGEGDPAFEVGVTGLALCAFLGAGYTNRGKHEFARVVGMGLRYLKNVQDPEGCFGPRTHMLYVYNHAAATLAMVEAYGMTSSPIFKAPAQRALDFIARSRNPYMAWRYGVRPGDNDTSVSAWMTMPLKSASLINAAVRARGKPEPLTIDQGAFDGMRRWLDAVTDPDTGRVGYMTRGSASARPQDLIDKFPAVRTEAMTAAGILSRTFLGEDPAKSAVIQKGAERLQARLPTWNPDDGSIDMAYWYFGTLAAFQVGGKTWRQWQKALQTNVLPHQRKDTQACEYRGSWDPIGVWGTRGGRVYATAIMTLVHETHRRYQAAFGTR